MARIICWRSGEAEIVSRPVVGSVSVMTGPRRQLEKLLGVHARHAHDGKTLLVPGLPEADSEDAAGQAVERFQLRLETSVFNRRKRA